MGFRVVFSGYMWVQEEFCLLFISTPLPAQQDGNFATSRFHHPLLLSSALGGLKKAEAASASPLANAEMGAPLCCATPNGRGMAVSSGCCSLSRNLLLLPRWQEAQEDSRRSWTSPWWSPVGKEPGSFPRRLAFYCFRRLFESSSHLVWGRLSLSNRHSGFGRVGEKRLERAICRNLPPAQAAQGDVSMSFCRLHLPCFSVILWFILWLAKQQSLGNTGFGPEAQLSANPSSISWKS